VCLVYDCLFPHTVGGAERWYRALAEALVRAGHEVTYLTRRQWPRGEQPDAPAGARVVAVSSDGPLYTADGRRSVGPPVRFGAGVLRHLERNGDRYDAVHTASFPYFSLLAAAAARSHGYRVVVDWHELWTRAYWREYLGPATGDLGWLVQRACVAVPQRAFCFSRLHERRLREEGLSGDLTVLEGEYAGDARPPEDPVAVEPVVVFAGRHIAEKQVPKLVPALAEARKRIPDLSAEILGDGPDRETVRRRIEELNLERSVALPGFVGAAQVDAALAGAMCMVLPSRREGYGLVVIEAAARGTPSVVVEGPDNAATELVEEGENGVIAASASPGDLAAAIEKVHAAGTGLRERTARWFERNRRRLSLEASLERVLESYGEADRR
jgi:glycosyltransferase involved in cell wall biosynthesis